MEAKFGPIAQWIERSIRGHSVRLRDSLRIGECSPLSLLLPLPNLGVEDPYSWSLLHRGLGDGNGGQKNIGCNRNESISLLVVRFREVCSRWSG